MRAPRPQVLTLRDRPQSQEVRPCYCTGPRNGDPVCPCKMAAFARRAAGERALDILLTKMTVKPLHPLKPRVRVKAIGRHVSG